MRTYCIAQGALLNGLWWSKWDRNQKGRGYIYIYIYVCIYMTDSLFYTVETNIRL